MLFVYVHSLEEILQLQIMSADVRFYAFSWPESSLKIKLSLLNIREGAKVLYPQIIRNVLEISVPCREIADKW